MDFSQKKCGISKYDALPKRRDARSEPGRHFTNDRLSERVSLK